MAQKYDVTTKEMTWIYEHRENPKDAGNFLEEEDLNCIAPPSEQVVC